MGKWGTLDKPLQEAFAQYGQRNGINARTHEGVRYSALRILAHGMGGKAVEEPHTLASLIELLQRPDVSKGIIWVEQLWPRNGTLKERADHRGHLRAWKGFLSFLASVDPHNDWTIADQVGQ
jgi:hypothetical protein